MVCKSCRLKALNVRSDRHVVQRFKLQHIEQPMNFPTWPCNIRQAPKQQVMKEFFSLGGLGMFAPGVCWSSRRADIFREILANPWEAEPDFKI